MPSRRTLASAALAALAVAGLGAAAAPASAAPGDATPGSPLSSYIVTVDPGTLPAAAAERARGLGGRIDHVYTEALHGFAVTLPPSAVRRLADVPGVIEVAPDQPVQATTTQTRAPWGLDRIDQRTLPLNGSYTYSATSSAVTAYVVDTGIRTAHSQFGGRASSGYDAWGGNAQDCNGHGTHVAGTIGGSTYGVAKGARLVAVRVLDCRGNGSVAGVIAGLDWVIGHRTGGAAVVNMSLSGPASTELDDAVARVVESGVTVAVAAGNGDAAGVPQDACSISPARVGTALTVGATDRTDAAASFSNHGTCVDLFAPGVGITSAWHTNNKATNTISGTSMATPHVAGVAALYLQSAPTAAPSAVATAVLGATSDGAVVTDTGKTPNDDLLNSTW